MFYRESILSNGIHVLSEQVTTVRSITLGLWFKIGSRDETDALSGMSHFMEHMMFKGTPTRSAEMISQEFEQLGAELNAFTSKEYTCYHARFVDDKLPAALEILSDMVINSSFAQEEIDSEREVVIEEIARCEDEPEDYVYDLFTRNLFSQHTLGRPIIGTREIVSSFNHDDCRAYHDAHYSCENLIIAASGNVDHDMLVALCERLFASLPHGEMISRLPYENHACKTHCFVKRETEQAHIIYGMPTLPANHPDRFAASLLDCALGGGMSSRLFQEIREKRGLAYAVYASSTPYVGIGMFAIYAGTRPSNIEQVYEIILREIDKLKKDGLSKAELDRVRDFVSGQIILGLEATRTRMIKLGKNAIMGNDLLSMEESLAAYAAVTLDDIARVADKLFAAPSTLAIISPVEPEELEKTLASK